MNTLSDLEHEVAAVIAEGFNVEEGVAVTAEAPDHITIEVVGFDKPILVVPGNVLIPDEYGEVPAAVALDVWSVLAQWEAKQKRDE